MRLLDRRMTEAASVGGLMLLRLWGPPNFLSWPDSADLCAAVSRQLSGDNRT
jgi:hypothetical protein